MNINSDVAFSVIAAQRVEWKKCVVKTDGQPHSALVLRLGSPAKLTVDGGKTIVSKPNEVTYMPSNTPYTAEYPEDGYLMFIHFTETTPFFSEAQNFVPAHYDEIYTLFSKIQSVCNLKRENYKIEAASLLLRIIVYLLKYCHSTSSNSRFQDAVKIMQEEYTDPKLTVSAVCQRAGISDSTLRKLFKEEFGMSPIRYLNEQRIDHAQRLLCANYCTVETAAVKSGFSDYRYFSRVVKKLRGCTPSMLRKI